MSNRLNVLSGLATVTTIALSMSYSTAFAATTATTQDSLLIPGVHQVTLNNQTIPVTTRTDNGRVVITSHTHLTPAQANQLEQEIRSSTSIEPNSFFAGSNTYNVYAEDNTPEVWSYGDFSATFSHPDNSQVELQANGLIEGFWVAAGTPSYMQLSQNLTVNGTAVTVSWPPGFSSSGTTTSYLSNPFNGATFVSSPYSGVSAYSDIAIYSYQQSDGVLARSGTTDWRAYDSLSANWLTGAENYSPTGGTW